MKAYIKMIGQIWMPATVAAMRRDLSAYDIANIQGYAEHLTGDTQLTREAVEHWLALNSGDFQGVDDFNAVIGAAEFPWLNDESECTFLDCMFPSEDE